MAKLVESSLTEGASLNSGNDALSLLKNLQLETVNGENKGAVFANALSRILDYFNADHGYICINDRTGRLKNIACKFVTETDNLITSSKAVIQKVLDTGNSVLVNNAMNSRQYPGDPAFQRFNIQAALCVPIKVTDETFGIIYLDTSGSRRWSDREKHLLDFIGVHTGLAFNHVENRRLTEAGKATLNLSHSVKNILQMISGAAEVIEYGLKKNEIQRVKRSWDILSPNLERLRKFMLDMLDYSKERKLETGPCDFNELIKGSIDLLKSKLKQIDSKLVLNEDKNIPTVELDGERIHEMSLNLILNAMDIVDKKTGSVQVETRFLEKERKVRLTVTDNGPGMTDEIKRKIFTPFESGRNKLGTGLGMAIAKQIVDQHEGKIEVDTKLGKGTTFKVTLPAITLTR